MATSGSTRPPGAVRAAGLNGTGGVPLAGPPGGIVKGDIVVGVFNMSTLALPVISSATGVHLVDHGADAADHPGARAVHARPRSPRAGTLPGAFSRASWSGSIHPVLAGFRRSGRFWGARWPDLRTPISWSVYSPPRYGTLMFVNPAISWLIFGVAWAASYLSST
jgi:hypothetical protein